MTAAEARMAPVTPWTGVFEIRDTSGQPIDGPVIPLTQTSASQFRVDASLHYLGDTGLDPVHDDEIRTLSFSPDRRTDLASVPAILRWFENPYGPHTPAALFHDRFLSEPSPITEVQADLYFRSMLKAVGVPIFKRLIMWTGIALRTRWASGLRNKVLLVLYVALSIIGTAVLISALLDGFGLGVTLPSRLGNPWGVAAASVLSWLAASALWGRQWNASLVAGAAAPWAIPAAALALVARGVYAVAERVAGRFLR